MPRNIKCVRATVLSIMIACVAAPRIVAQTTDSNQAADQEKEGDSPSSMDQPGQQQNLPSLITPLKPQRESSPYEPITHRQRLRWFITNTIGPSHLVGGVFTSAFGTALDRPPEYGPGWAGFGDRYGMRLTGIVTGNSMEASVGALWGEDPRYFRVPDQPFGARVKSVVRQTFMARRRDGNYAPAYARFIAVPGNNFLSNAWRPHSEANVQDALFRTGEGFAGRMASNAFEEFWPTVRDHLFHRRE